MVYFDRPAYLVLLVLLPLLWWWGRKSLTALGRWRRSTALALRGIVAAAIVLALAEPHLVRRHDRLAVIYLLDRSLSVPGELHQAAIEFINQSRILHRDASRGDMAGIIVFGREAAVELPLLEGDWPLVRVESHVDGQQTDLAGALRLARACFPPDCAKRVVILSDGNETLDSAAEEARRMAEGQISIDVVPLWRDTMGDVAVDKISLPREVRQGAPFDVRIVLNNSDPRNTRSGLLQVFRGHGESQQLVSEQSVALAPGKQVYSFREELSAPDFYNYEARFLPGQSGDAVPENNRATAFTQIRGNGRVLLIEDWADRGNFEHFIDRLRQANIEVEVRSSNRPFSDLADLQRFDTVVLADVPRTSGNTADNLTDFGDEQVESLVRNTEHLGAGLVMLGGPDSFGAGGWSNTPLEEAMPLDFHVENLRVVPSGALLAVIDRSGSMNGLKLEMCKRAATAALEVLASTDYMGVIAFNSESEWIVPLQRVGSRGRIARQIIQLGSGGGTNMMTGMSPGYRVLGTASASVKHMIVLTDGNTEGAGYERLATEMRAQGITTTSVAVGGDASVPLMEGIARSGGGKFYHVTDPRTIPRIFMKEARRVARPLVYENEQPFGPSVELDHEMLAGVSEAIPPITGFVMTTVKDNPLVEVLLSSPKPGPTGHALLAAWTYGLGRSVALTTDVGQRWSKAWSEWESYDKLFSQLVRWSMRPTGDAGNFVMHAEARDGKLQVTVTAVDQEGNFLNFLAMQGAVVGPNMEAISLALAQTAPGRYVGECSAEEAGSYFVSIVPGPQSAPLRAGVNVPCSTEFRALTTNVSLLASLARQQPVAGASGRVFGMVDPVTTAKEANVFRHDLPPATSRQPGWHLMVLCAACLFLLDVVNRKVVFSAAPLIARVMTMLPRHGDTGRAPETIDRLRHRKSEVSRYLDERRGAARFEFDAEAADLSLDLAEPDEVPPRGEHPEAAIASDEVEASYTERLLQAKRRLRKQ